MKTLKDAKVGQTVTVIKLHGEGAVRRRIMDMGITKGVEIYIRKVAPLGDPVEINLRGYELSLRKADAEMGVKGILGGGGIVFLFLHQTGGKIHGIGLNHRTSPRKEV